LFHPLVAMLANERRLKYSTRIWEFVYLSDRSTNNNSHMYTTRQHVWWSPPTGTQVTSTSTDTPTLTWSSSFNL